ncbi:MAG: rhodanese-like domain-containing protein [Actinomycetota bacterium]|nr:rhodanese-like domain-containing protein [Actinomycetota bacterium]MEC9424876.1 rhodanese-like domain-containing protein [Actinomycetota bacterium]MED5220414.1 rhodanese-like domain-containing protein [Actinomycetota bacterium]MED5233224.1 rhodanese-like domain-containing protein [Actinomycetota bacterium]MED5394824.1 rhodanese-like domain-containing protein [Actinomycetota bacterium]
MTEGLTVPEVDVEALQKMLAGGAKLLDVREPDEVDEVRVPGGLPIPLQSLPERLDEIPSSDTLYVICAVGGRSRTAVEFLRDNGIDAVNVTGGTNAWVAADFPTEAGPDNGAAP